MTNGAEEFTQQGKRRRASYEMEKSSTTSIHY